MVSIKITLRKRNSVTSIVLFIYNIYNQVTGETEIELGYLLDYINKFGKSDSAARVSLSRMVKADIVVNENRDGRVYYKLTEEGLSNIEEWNRGIERFFARYSLRHNEWDKKWVTITMIDFKKSSDENQVILENLYELGYQEVDNNVWLSPYYQEEIKSLLCQINYLLSRGAIETKVGNDLFIKKLYQINGLRKKYQQFLTQTEKMQQEIRERNLQDGDLLPILFKLGWNFYDIVIDDPALPEEILGTWEGDRAVKKMNKFRNFLVSGVDKYFKNIN